MSVVDHEAGAAPALASPRIPEEPLSLFQFLRVLRDNSLSTYRPDVHAGSPRDATARTAVMSTTADQGGKVTITL